jgi:transcriptional regulator with XRE-family HTH domain
MGVSPQYINKVVRGKENLSLETICKLEHALGIQLIQVVSSFEKETQSLTVPGQGAVQLAGRRLPLALVDFNVNRNWSYA